MKPIVVLPFYSQAELFCAEARQMLLEAGFELRCNETGKRPTPEDLRQMLSGAYAVVAGTEKYTADVIEAADQLKAVIRFGVGTDNFDIPAMREKGLAIGVIANHNSVAEFTLTLMLGMIKNLPRLDTAARDGQWARFPMRELSGKTVGLVGFGRIGRRLGELLKGFQVELLAYDPFVPAEVIQATGAEPVTLEQLLGRSDIVSLHLPSTPQTHHLINAETLSRMKDGAYLVNTARGALVDEKALYEALTSYGYRCAKPTGAFYMFVRAPKGTAQEFSDRAKAKDLLIVPGGDFGCPNHFRISTCVDHDMLLRSLPVFKALIEEE